MMASESAAAVAEKIKSRGGYVYVISGDSLVTTSKVMESISDALKFPKTFGRNLDALYDCLTDLSWLSAGEHTLIWAGSDSFKKADLRGYLAIRGVLSDAQRALASGGDRLNTRRLTVFLTES